MNARSLNEVVEILNGIIDQSKKENNRIGYFAALYRLITFSVIAGIANNRFQDGPRMERFDVVFARSLPSRSQGWSSLCCLPVLAPCSRPSP